MGQGLGGGRADVFPVESRRGRVRVSTGSPPLLLISVATRRVAVNFGLNPPKSPDLTLSPSTFRNTNKHCIIRYCFRFDSSHNIQRNMKSLAGSKRTARTLFASPTKAAASAKRSRTQYDYYDAEDSESPHEDQWSAETDSGSEMSVDWDDERASPCDRFVANTSRGPTSTRKNACVGCAYGDSGHRCSSSTCGCQGGAACHNPFKKVDLGALFGQDRVALHPCFVAWVTSLKNAEMERVSAQSLFDLLSERADVLARYEGFRDNVAKPYLEWRTKWDRLPVSERDTSAGLVLKQELLRMGLTAREGQPVFVSFCIGGNWQESDHAWHCQDCVECMTSEEWHCEGCNWCSNGIGYPCNKCGRVEDGRDDSEGEYAERQ